MIGLLYRDLCQLVWHWWSSDRIRVSPVDGRFLRIASGDLLTLEGIDTIVLERCDSDRDIIRLTCRTETGLAELQVRCSFDGGSPELTWNECGRSRLLETNNVQIWPRRSN